MMGYGQVVGGQYMNATVNTNHRGELVVQSGFKRRKIDDIEVVEWEEVAGETRGGALGTVGQAVVGTLPGFVGKAASAAVSATVDATNRPPRVVRIVWTDGKQSLVKLPEKLFTHLSVLLEDRRLSPLMPPSLPGQETAAPKQDVTSQVLTHLAGMLKDRQSNPAAPTSASGPDITEQIVKLATLRDQGILTEDEFATKKAELLSRL